MSETSPPGTRWSTSASASAPADEGLGVTIVNRTALRAAASRRAAVPGSTRWEVVEGAGREREKDQDASHVRHHTREAAPTEHDRQQRENSGQRAMRLHTRHIGRRSREPPSPIRATAAGERVIPSEVAGRLAEFTPRADLSEREIEVLRLTAKGLRNRDIARAIGRTEETVKAHLKNIMGKLAAADRTEAVMIGLRRGIIHLDD